MHMMDGMDGARALRLALFQRINKTALAAALGLLLLLSHSPARADIEGAIGGAVGVGEIGTYTPAAGSPVVGIKWDPFRWKVRPTVGITSMPTYVYWIGDDYGSIPLVMGELGLAVGSRTTRLELVGQGGLFAFGAGLHFTHVPWKLGRNVRTGFELRSGWLAPSAVYGAALWKVRFGRFDNQAH
jgi:hypothetical protein